MAFSGRGLNVVRCIGLLCVLTGLALLVHSAAAAAAPSRCLVSQLDVKPGFAGVAAGSVGQTVHFTDVSQRACTLYGYPGMQMLDAAGKPIPTEVHRGASVSVQSRPVRLVTLAPGREASFDIGYADATGFGNEKCPTSARVEVTPPNDYGHLTIAWRLAPYGGDIPHLECGVITVSPVYPGS